MARKSRTTVGVAVVLLVAALTGCAPSHRAGHELESPHAADDLGVTLLTHEQATAEADKMLKLLTDFMPIKIGAVDTAYKKQCIFGETNVSNGASDFAENIGEPVANYADYAHRFVDHAEKLGYQTESLWEFNGETMTWFTYRDAPGTLVEVDLYPDRSIVTVYSRCYPYDWPELTPTPSPSGG